MKVRLTGIARGGFLLPPVEVDAIAVEVDAVTPEGDLKGGGGRGDTTVVGGTSASVPAKSRG